MDIFKVLSDDELIVFDIDLLTQKQKEHYFDVITGNNQDLTILFKYADFYIKFYQKTKKDGQDSINAKDHHKFYLLTKLFELREIQKFIAHDLLSGQVTSAVKLHTLSKKLFKRFYDIRKKRYKNVVRPFMRELGESLDQFTGHGPVFKEILLNAYKLRWQSMVTDIYAKSENGIAKALHDGWLILFLKKRYKDRPEIINFLDNFEKDLKEQFKDSLDKYDENIKRDFQSEAIQMGGNRDF